MGVLNRVLAYGLVFLLFGCKGNLNDPILVVNVEDEFKLGLWESLSDGSRELELRLATIQEEPCLNYEIIYRLESGVNSIDLSLQEIIPPENCEEGFGPAMASVPIGSFSEGFKFLTIDLNGTVVNQGRLTASSDRYELIFPDEVVGIQLDHPILLRAPQEALWGYLTWETSLNGDSLSTAWHDALAPLVDDYTGADGYYGHFTLEGQTGEVSIYDQPAENVLSFVHIQTGSDADLSNLVEAFRQQYGEDIELVVRTGNGQSF